MVQRYRQRTGSRPNRTWAATSVAATQVPPASKVLLGAFGPTTQGIDETILRSVGMLSVVSDQAGVHEEQRGALGICLATDTAITAGVASLPGPITEGSDDGWMLYVPIAQSGAIATDGMASYSYPFDSRAKRILQPGYSFAIVVENDHASHAFKVQLVIRILGQVRGTR